MNSSLPTKVPSQGKILRQLYLAIFLRGRGARGMTKETRPKSIKARLAYSLLIYALVGVVAVSFFRQPLFSLSLYLHGTTLILLGMFVAASAGEVMFNKDEAEILLHRPVTAKALLQAKVSMLLQVSLWLGAAFNLVGLAVGTFNVHGSYLFAPAHLISTGLASIFCTGSVVLVYQLCLRWFGRDRLDGMMTMAQVGMTLLIVVGGQAIPRLMRYLPNEITLNAKTWWLALLPPAWFAGLDEVMIGRGNAGSWCLAAAGIVITGGLVWLAFGKLAQSYGSGLQMLSESKPRTSLPDGRRRGIEKLTNSLPLRWLLRDPVERAGFLLVGAYMMRDREVKLRLYPGVASLMIMPFMMLITGVGERWSFGVALSGGYLAMTPMFALQLLQYSENWQAADVFRATPVSGPAPLLIGARKAVTLFLSLPAMLILAFCVWYFSGRFSTLVFLLPGLLALPACARIQGTDANSLPLSAPGEQAKSAGRGLIVIFVMIAAMVIAGLAVAADHLGYLWEFLGVELIISVVYSMSLEKRTRRLVWPSIE